MSHYVHNSRIRKIEAGKMPEPVKRKGTTSSSERKDALKKRVSLPKVGASASR